MQLPSRWGRRWKAAALTSALAAGGLALGAFAMERVELGVAIDDAAADFEDLSAEYEDAQAEFRKQVGEIRESEGELEAQEYERDWSPLPAFLDQFAAKGAEYAGTEGAIPFWMFVLSNDLQGDGGMPGAMCEQALTALLADHQSAPQFRQHVENMGRSAKYVGIEPTLALLDAILEDTTDDWLRLRALFSRGRARMDSEDEATRKLAIVDLKAVIEQAPEEDPLGKRAKGVLFEAENLQIGCVAPDIEGSDLSGVAFKLSDYRGKVVVLDFWGDW